MQNVFQIHFVSDEDVSHIETHCKFKKNCDRFKNHNPFAAFSTIQVIRQLLQMANA